MSAFYLFVSVAPRIRRGPGGIGQVVTRDREPRRTDPDSGGGDRSPSLGPAALCSGWCRPLRAPAVKCGSQCPAAVQEPKSRPSALV